ncbi:MAG: hypothetical protein AABY61_08940 [Nitrospirota bacterium]
MLVPSSGQNTGMRIRDRLVVWIAIGLVLLSVVWALRDLRVSSPAPTQPTNLALTPEAISLVTGDEPIVEVLTRPGCPVCHIIPGIPGATGQVGPPLVLGTTGERRLKDPGYRGEATTVHEYIVESVLEPQRFVVRGYPEKTMPTWYGSKLSALALEKMASYLERQTEEGLAP